MVDGCSLKEIRWEFDFSKPSGRDVFVGLHVTQKMVGSVWLTNFNTKSIQHSGRCTWWPNVSCLFTTNSMLHIPSSSRTAWSWHLVEVVIPVSVRDLDLDLLRFHSKAAVLEALLSISCQMMVI